MFSQGAHNIHRKSPQTLPKNRHFIAVIFTKHMLYKHTGSKVGKKAVQDRWTMQLSESNKLWIAEQTVLTA